MENSILKDIGRSYIVSSFLPAALFATSGVLFYYGFIPKAQNMSNIGSEQFFLSQWFLFFVVVVWLAFFLYSIVNWTIRLFEGYYFPEPLSSSLKNLFIYPWYQEKTQEIREVRQVVRKKPKDRSSEDLATYFLKRENALSSMAILETRMPLRKDALMPTRLGNIFLATEIYPDEKYSIKGVPMWPRLAQVLPDRLRNDIEEKNNQIVFLLNSALLSFVNSIIGFSIGIYHLPCKIVIENLICQGTIPVSVLNNSLIKLSETGYIYLGFAWVLIGYFIYLMSIPTAEEMCQLVRASFDLYRFDLLVRLNQTLPVDLEHEQNLWMDISEYMVADNQMTFTPFNFSYTVRRDLMETIKLRISPRKRKSKPSNLQKKKPKNPRA